MKTTKEIVTLDTVITFRVRKELTDKIDSAAEKLSIRRVDVLRAALAEYLWKLEHINDK